MGDADPLGHGQQDVLDREVLVTEPLTLPAGLLEDGLRLARQRRPLAAVAVGELGKGLLQAVAQRQDGDPHPRQHGQHGRAFLAQQRQQKMVRRYLRVVAPAGVRVTAALKASWVFCVQRFGSIANVSSPVYCRRR